jgi:hypothetical protein
MQKSRWVSASLVASFCLAAISQAPAQSAQPISIQVSGLFAPLSGDAYDNIKAGKGVEAQLRYTPGAFSYGAGFQYTKHPADANLGLDLDFTLMGFFFEPRYVIDAGSNVFAPYLSGRLALLRQTLTIPDQPTAPPQEGHANGGQINGGGGILFRLTPTVNVDAGLTYGYIRFGTSTIKNKETGASTTGERSSGQNWVIRLGFAVGLGK